MIFKGNTKMTPAITELLDDNTPSNNKTYSSNKIETLIGGGGSGNIILYKKYNNTKWLNKLSTITNLNKYEIMGSGVGVNFITINLNDFDVVNNISDLENYNLYLKINSISQYNNLQPFSNIHTIIETEATNKIMFHAYITLNNVKVCDLYGNKNLTYRIGGAEVIDCSGNLIPLYDTSKNSNVNFKIHSTMVDFYTAEVINNNVKFTMYANFDNTNFKNIEILLYAIKK